MAASNLRFGAHATSEVGMDFANLIKEMPAVDRSQAKIGVFTDPNVAKLPVMEIVEESLLREGLDFVVWDKCAVEPTDKSWQVSLKLQAKRRTRYFPDSTDAISWHLHIIGSSRFFQVFTSHSFPGRRWWIFYGHC